MPSADELRSYLAEKLPQHMIPHAFVFLDDLPLTPNGKIDRKALPEPDAGPIGSDHLGPRTATETRVAEIWAELLGLNDPGIEENFFVMGGDSLLATKLIMRLRAAFQVDIPVRAIFEAPTIAGLARSIERSGAQVEAARPITSRPRTGAIPMSSGQQRLWFHDRLYPGNTTYNTQQAVRLVGTLDVAALERAVNEILRRHEILHTIFAERDGQPIQVIVPHEPLEVPVTDLRHESGDRQRQAAQRIVENELSTPFDLQRGPLLRPLLLRLSDTEHVMIVTAHHIATDGWTDSIFVSEFVALYGAFSRGEPSPLEEPRLHYADFAMWEQDRLQSGAFRPHIDYWKHQLRGDLPVLALPVDHLDAKPAGHNGGNHLFSLSRELTTAIKALCEREGVTLFMALMAAWQTLLHYYARQDDILVGTPHANREQHEVAGIAGFFVNSLVMRADFSGNPTIAEVLRRTRDTALAAYTYQELPFDKLVEELRSDGRDLPTPLFRAWFVLHNVPRPDFELDGLTVSQVETHHLTDVHDLKLDVAERTHGLDCDIHYRKHLFAATTIARTAALFELLLRTMVESTGYDLKMLTSMLADKERQLKEAEEREERAQLANGLKSVRRQITRIAPAE